MLGEWQVETLHWGSEYLNLLSPGIQLNAAGYLLSPCLKVISE